MFPIDGIYLFPFLKISFSVLLLLYICTRRTHINGSSSSQSNHTQVHNNSSNTTRNNGNSDDNDIDIVAKVEKTMELVRRTTFIAKNENLLINSYKENDTSFIRKSALTSVEHKSENHIVENKLIIPTKLTNRDGTEEDSSTFTKSTIFSGSCSICLEDFKEGDSVSWSSNFSCSHAFHEKCIVTWLCSSRGGNNLCPTCRQSFLSESI